MVYFSTSPKQCFCTTSGLSARVPERQKNKNGGLDQYGFEHFVV